MTIKIASTTLLSVAGTSSTWWAPIVLLILVGTVILGVSARQHTRYAMVATARILLVTVLVDTIHKHSMSTVRCYNTVHNRYDRCKSWSWSEMLSDLRCRNHAFRTTDPSFHSGSNYFSENRHQIESWKSWDSDEIPVFPVWSRIWAHIP